MGRTHSRSDDFALSRRDFLAALSVPVVVGAAGVAGLTIGCGEPPLYNAADFVLPSRSAMGLFPAADYSVDFADLITRGFKELGINVAGRRVLLKPNMVEYEPGTAINTHPLVVAGAAVACRRVGSPGTELEFAL